KHLQSDIPSVKRFNEQTPQSVENIVLKATTKNPFHRYETVYDMEEAIETALHPNKINEEKYEPPVEAGEETKAIPIITDDHIKQNNNQDTIIHQPNETTKRFNQEQHGENEQQHKHRKKKKRKWIIFSTIAFILLASVVLALFVIPGILKPEEV